ncbi:WD repeat-containing protein 6 [Hondaea fermentalgiana]|uniref:WD repeat-containing protein 6 n=1 Tax=Hondaea fermentalgiana TaxID=2315210 RepID=A0A2R5H1H4_9STRA|nr:WD repeat-containing protein 6 [Hondaea fermentalgiana]|eukprot:GBG34194.1 WD repeat-containing protein 6 [Hondaea fermentalgiana]
MSLDLSAAFLPVTALTFWDLDTGASAEKSRQAEGRPPVLLLAGAGSDVRTYELRRRQGDHGDASSAEWAFVSSQSMLPSAVVHGICPDENIAMAQQGKHEPRCLVFGHRRAKICTWDPAQGGALQTRAVLEGISDLVWDATWVSLDSIALGTAQGFVEVYSKLDDGTSQWARSHRVLCTARCILYSLAFSPVVDHAQVLLASGTVFGEIILWAGASTDGEPLRRLEGHHGPVFRVSWSADGRQLCSVGDDRTVRVWTAQEGLTDFAETWKAFGHNARIWDCVFAPRLDAVATVGEDRQVRVWGAKDGAPLALFEAHFGRHIWRCALWAGRYGTQSDAQACVLATGGGDSAVNVFDLEREVTSRAQMRALLCRRNRASANATSLVTQGDDAVNGEIGKVEDDGSKRKRRKGVQVSVSLIHHVPQADGNDTDQIQLMIFTSSGAIYALDGTMVDAPWVDLYTPTKSNEEFKPFIVHHTPGSTDVLVGTRRGQVILFRDETKGFDAPHALVRVATVNVFENPVASVAQLLLCASGTVLVTTPSGSGIIRVWNVVETGKDLVLTERFAAEARSTQVAVYTCTAEISALETLVLGDSRGSLHWVGLNTDKGSQLVRSLPRAHGTCKIGCLKVDRSGAIYSGGHNSTIVKLKPRTNAGIVIALEAVCVIRLAHVLDQINELKWTSPEGDLVAAGFQYTDYVVWNTRTHTPLLRDRCGGWRRPGTVVLDSKPFRKCAMFYTESAHERRDRGADTDDLAIHRVGRLASTLGLEAGAGCTLGQVFHSRSVWVARWLPGKLADHLIVGCEDGLLSLIHARGPRETRVIAQRQRERSVRCACILDGGLPDYPVVFVTGSSNQVLRAWHVDPEAAHASEDDGFVLLAETMPVDEVDANTAQTEETDGVAASHRVLGLYGHGDLVVVGTSTGQLVVYALEVCKDADKIDAQEDHDKMSGQSPGAMEVPPLKGRFDPRVPLKGRFVQLQELEDLTNVANTQDQANGGNVKAQGVVEEEEEDDDEVEEENDEQALDVNSMAKPVRCLTGHYDATSNTLWLFVGRTNGAVEVWSGADGGRGTWRLECTDNLHSMGVNCVDVAVVENENLLVVSGSDDQSLSAFVWSQTARRRVGGLLRVPEADASALRGVHTNGKSVWSCGLNQRLRRWRLRPEVLVGSQEGVLQVRPHMDESTQTTIELEHEVIVDVADVNCLTVQSRQMEDGDTRAGVAVGGVGVRVFF